MPDPPSHRNTYAEKLWEPYEEGRLVVAPAVPWKVRLEELLGGITEANRHAEISTGPPVGNEFW